MRIRTLFAITLTMFALPAIAVEPPVTPPLRERLTLPAPAAGADLSVSFEVRLLKAPVGFCERAGVKLTGDAVLAEKDVFRLLEAVQSQRDTNVMQLPKVTADDGQTVTVRNTESRSFITAIEAMKVKGQTVFVPQNKAIELGDVFTITGHVLADQKRVSLRANMVRTMVAPVVDLAPVVTQVTPVFEGGSQGQPVPFTQYLQVPDIKTEKVEKTAIVPTGGTIVLGTWKETGERPARKALIKKEKAAPEYEVVVLATPRVFQNDEPAVGAAPAPRAVLERVTKVFGIADVLLPNASGQSGGVLSADFRWNADNIVKIVTGKVRPGSWDSNGGRGQAEYFEIGCALVVTDAPDVVNEVGDLIEALRRQNEQAPEAAPMPRVVCARQPSFPAAGFGSDVAAGKHTDTVGRVYKFRNVAAADAAQAVNTFLTAKKLSAMVVAEPVSNFVSVTAEPAVQEQVLTLLAALDRTPHQVLLQTMVVQVPRGFAARYGLVEEGAANGAAVTLSPREAKMLAGLVLAAKERNECDVLSRPQLLVRDNQSGAVRLGQEFPVQTLGLIMSDSGTVLEPKTEYVPTGLSMRFTPRVAPDGTFVRVTAELENTTVSSTMLPTGSPEHQTIIQVPVFNSVSVRAASDVRLGQTMLVVMAQETNGSLTGTIRRLLNRDQDETLVVVTPHLLISSDPLRPAGEIRK